MNIAKFLRTLILKNIYEQLLLQLPYLFFLFISFSPSKRGSSFPGMIPLFVKKDLMVFQKNLSLLDVLILIFNCTYSLIFSFFKFLKKYIFKEACVLTIERKRNCRVFFNNQCFVTAQQITGLLTMVVYESVCNL